MERGAGLESGNEASHDRHTKGGTAVGEVGVRDNMAVDLELLQGHSIVSAGGEEQHVPVVVSHPEGKVERGSNKSKGKETAQYFHMGRAEDAAREGLGEAERKKEKHEARNVEEGMRKSVHKESRSEEMIDGEDDQMRPNAMENSAQRRSRNKGSAGRVEDGKIG